MTTAEVRATGLPKDDVQRIMDHYLVDETAACQALALAPASALVGAITCEVIKCPNCRTRLKICYQALAPEYLIEDAKCPKCGTVVAHWVLSIREAPFPVEQVIGAISGGVVFAVIAKKNPKFITQFIAIPVGVGVGVAIAKVF